MEIKETEKKKMPSDVLKVKIGINPYEIKFPTNGQLIDIESLKIRLTGGAIKDMMFASPSSMDAYIITSAIATFDILLPQLKADMQVSALDLNPLQSKSIKKAYEEYYKWMEEWRAVINEEFGEDAK